MLHVTEQNSLPPLLTNPAVPLRYGRCAAVLAVACLLAHIPMIATHFAMTPIVSVVMSVVSLLCIPCARRLWSAPSTQDCATAAALAAVMIGLHLFLGISTAASIAPPPDMSMPMHHHGGTAAMPEPSTATEIHDHMAMSGTIGVLFYLATAMAAAQILLNVVAIVITVRRTKIGTHLSASHSEVLRAARPS